MEEKDSNQDKKQNEKETPTDPEAEKSFSQPSQNKRQLPPDHHLPPKKRKIALVSPIVNLRTCPEHGNIPDNQEPTISEAQRQRSQLMSTIFLGTADLDPDTINSNNIRDIIIIPNPDETEIPTPIPVYDNSDNSDDDTMPQYHGETIDITGESITSETIIYTPVVSPASSNISSLISHGECLFIILYTLYTYT